MTAAPAASHRPADGAEAARSRAWDWLVVALLLCATLVMTYPLPAQLGTHLAGDDYDVWNRPWVTWWTKMALREGRGLYWTDMLFYPRGVSLVYHSFSHVNTAIALLLEPLAGWIAAHNITVLLAYFLSGVGAYFLARDLTGRRDAGLVAGLIFAFSTYHVDQSAHVILLTIQWIPLWILAVVRLFRGQRPVRRAVEAALFLTLTALSSWHLLLFSAIWLAFYLVALLIWERDRVDWPRIRALTLMGLATGLLVGPLLFPLVSGLLSGGDGGDVAVPYRGENAIDVLAFFVPSRRHPVFGPLVEPIHGRIGRRQVFLGYLPLALAAVGAATAWRKARFWVLSTLAFFAMSLGAYVRFNGQLSDRAWQPWLIPLIEFIRDPTRLTVMTTLGLAVLAAMGAAWLLRRVRRPAAVGLAVALSALILFEFLPWPFPTTPIQIPSFYEQIGGTPGSFALADLPVRHLEARRQMMFYQVVHQKPIIEGIVARTPPEAYAFIEAHPILSTFADDAEPPGLDLSRRLDALAGAGVRYLVLHRRFMTAEQMGRWQAYLPYEPHYQDDAILVYQTEPVVGQDLPVAFPITADVGLALVRLDSRYPQPGDSLALRAAWVAARDPAAGYRVRWSLIDREGSAVHSVERPLCPDWPVEDWAAGDFAWGEYALSAAREPGPYRLQVALLDEEGEEASRDVGSLLVPPDGGAPAVNPDAARVATFGDQIALLELDVIPGDGMLHLELDWAALRPVDADYKVFVHLFDAAGELAGQVDTMPRDWTAPTSAWQPDRVVSDLISLDTYGLPTGTYTLSVGLYDPASLDRLPLRRADGAVLPDGALVREVELP